MIYSLLYYIIFAVLGIVFDLSIGTYGTISENLLLPSVVVLLAALWMHEALMVKKFGKTFLSSLVKLAAVVMAMFFAYFILPVCDLPYIYFKICEFTASLFADSALYFHDIERGVNLVSIDWLKSINVFEVSIYKTFPNILISLFFAFLFRVAEIDDLARRIWVAMGALCVFVLYSTFIIVCSCLIIIATGELLAGIDLFVQILLILPLLMIITAADHSFIARQKSSSGNVWETKISVCGIVLLAVSLFSLMLVFFFKPYGSRPEDVRILIDDVHSDWEKCETVFNDQSFSKRESYAATMFYKSVQMFGKADIYNDDSKPIDAAMLKNYDILVIKTPTYQYTGEEVDSIEQFVNNGGGLLIIGDHTNLFGMSSFLNKILDKFSMSFNYDSQFDMLTGGMTIYKKPMWNTDPSMAYVDKFKFLTGCTLRAPFGTASMIGRGMCSEPVEYSHVNSFGNIKCEVKEGWGNYTQMASAYSGRGRIVAFTDSTYMSNFCYMFDCRDDLTFSVLDFLARKSSFFYLFIYQILEKLTLVFLIAIPISIVLIRRKYFFIASWIVLGGYIIFVFSIIYHQILENDPTYIKSPIPIINLRVDKSIVGFDAGFEGVNRPHPEFYYDQFIGNLCRKGFYIRYSNCGYKLNNAIDMFMLPEKHSFSEQDIIPVMKSGKHVLCLFDFPENYSRFNEKILSEKGFRLFSRKEFNKEGNLTICYYAYEHIETKKMLFIIFDRSVFSKKYHGMIYQNFNEENHRISFENFKIIDEIHKSLESRR
ncbi:hypothetical protein [Akkermansia sp. AKK6]